jgi:hypothetical protein
MIYALHRERERNILQVATFTTYDQGRNMCERESSDAGPTKTVSSYDDTFVRRPRDLCRGTIPTEKWRILGQNIVFRTKGRYGYCEDVVEND